MSAGTRIEWAIALQELCKMANVAFFFKKPSKGDVIPAPGCA